MNKTNQILKWTVRMLSIVIAMFATTAAVYGIIYKFTILVTLCMLGAIALTLIIFTLLLYLSYFCCRHPHHNGHRHGHHFHRDRFRRDKRNFKFRDKASNDIKEDAEEPSASDNSADVDDNSVVDKYL